MGRMLTTGRQVPALPGSTLRPKPRRTAHASVIRPVARAALEALGRAAAAGSDKSPLECVGVCDAAPTRECSPLPIFAAVFFTSFVLDSVDFRPASAGKIWDPESESSGSQKETLSHFPQFCYY